MISKQLWSIFVPLSLIIIVGHTLTHTHSTFSSDDFCEAAA